MSKSEESIHDLLNAMNKSTNIRIIGVPEEEREKGTESLFKEIRAKKSKTWGKTWTSKLMKLTDHPSISGQKDLFQDTL